MVNQQSKINTMEAAISLEHVKDELGVRIYKDANDLLYFAEEDEKLILAHFGSTQGFEKIMVYENFVYCLKVAGLFEIYLRKEKEWISYKPHKNAVSYDFYDEKPIAITDDYLILHTENSRMGEYACFSFELNDFIYSPYDRDNLGLFERNLEITSFRNQKAFIFSLDKLKLVFLLTSKTFVTIPVPEEYAKEAKDGEPRHFLFFCEKYAVLKYGYNHDPKFFVYSFVDSEYKNIDKEHDFRLAEKYWKPGGVICTKNHIALAFCSQTASPSVYYEVLSTETWESIEQKFETSISSPVFDEVSLENGDLILSYDFKNRVRVKILS